MARSLSAAMQKLLLLVDDGDDSPDGWRTVFEKKKKIHARVLGLMQEPGEDKKHVSLISGGSFNADDLINRVTLGIENF